MENLYGRILIPVASRTEVTICKEDIWNMLAALRIGTAKEYSTPDPELDVSDVVLSFSGTWNTKCNLGNDQERILQGLKV